MGTAAAFLACYFSLCISAPGKPPDPGISSEFLPAVPGIHQGASRRSHLFMHVDPRDALVHHFHELATSCSGTPHRMGQGTPPARAPGQNRSLTHAHAAAAGVTRQGARHQFLTRPRTVHRSTVTTGGAPPATVHLPSRPPPPAHHQDPRHPASGTRQRRQGPSFRVPRQRHAEAHDCFLLESSCSRYRVESHCHFPARPRAVIYCLRFRALYS